MSKTTWILLLALLSASFVKQLNAQGWIGLTARNTSQGNSQESYIIINPEATSGFDRMYDLEFLPGNGPCFYSLAGDEKLSTNSLPDLTTETEISYVFIANGGNNYQIEASGLELIESQVFLYDRKTRSDWNLSQIPVYSFTSNQEDDSTRFLIHFSPTGVDRPIESQAFFISYYDESLHFNTLTMNDLLILYDMQGRKLNEIQPGEGNNHTFPIQLPSGIYMFRLISGKETLVRKILIQ